MSFAQRLLAHCAPGPRTVLYDPEAALLLDLPSGKTLSLPASRIAALEERKAEPGIASLEERAEPESLCPSLEVRKDESRIQSLEERAAPESLRPSLVVRLDDGRTLALTEGGIAFPPRFTNTGLLEELPAEVCWRDFQPLIEELKRQLYRSRPDAATVRVLMCCLAIVDGARAAGFDVVREEQELEWHLRELERQAPG